MTPTALTDRLKEIHTMLVPAMAYRACQGGTTKAWASSRLPGL